MNRPPRGMWVECVTCDGFGTVPRLSLMDEGPHQEPCPDCTEGAQWLHADGRVAPYPGGETVRDRPPMTDTELVDADASIYPY